MKDYRDFLDTQPELFAASYPWLLNRGIFMTPGDEEQWTLSVQHTDADIDRYIEVFTRVLRGAGGVGDGRTEGRRTDRRKDGRTGAPGTERVTLSGAKGP